MCTSSEMRVTTNSIITTSPSTRVPTVNLIAPFCHQVKLSTTGFTIASPWPLASLLKMPRPRPRRPSL